MRKFYCYCFMSALLLVGSAALAGTVPTISPLEFGDTSVAAVGAINASPEAHWIWTVVIIPCGLSALVWLGRFVDNWIRERLARRQTDLLVQAYNFVACGVDETYESFVRPLKAAVENGGRLTEADKNKAKEDAIRTAKAYASKQGIDLVKTIGPKALGMLIEQVIGDRKAGRYVFSPLPDLSPSTGSVD